MEGNTEGERRRPSKAVSVPERGILNVLQPERGERRREIVGNGPIQFQ